MTVLSRWPYYRGGRIIEVAVLSRWPYYRGGRKAGFHCTHKKDNSSSLQSFVFPSSSIRCFKSVLKQFLGAFLCPVM